MKKIYGKKTRTTNNPKMICVETSLNIHRIDSHSNALQCCRVAQSDTVKFKTLEKSSTKQSNSGNPSRSTKATPTHARKITTPTTEIPQLECPSQLLFTRVDRSRSRRKRSQPKRFAEEKIRNTSGREWSSSGVFRINSQYLLTAVCVDLSGITVAALLVAAAVAGVLMVLSVCWSCRVALFVLSMVWH